MATGKAHKAFNRLPAFAKATAAEAHFALRSQP
jgi:hypothetical protein